MHEMALSLHAPLSCCALVASNICLYPSIDMMVHDIHVKDNGMSLKPTSNVANIQNKFLL